LTVKCVNNGSYNVFVIVDDEYIGPAISAGYEWDGWMRQDIEKYYKTGTEILDIGANIGYNSLMFSDYGPVYAFEPIFYKVVKMNIENNELKHKLEVIPIALSDQNRTANMCIPSKLEEVGLRNYGGTSIHRIEHLDTNTKTSVTCRKLDDIYVGNTSFMKIDVEGHELQVLKGAENTIKKFMPTILIEIFDFENNEVPKYLKSLGYNDPEPRPESMYLYRAKDIFSTM
jgi:FkbM family methyltransferase